MIFVLGFMFTKFKCYHHFIQQVSCPVCCLPLHQKLIPFLSLPLCQSSFWLVEDLRNKERGFEGRRGGAKKRGRGSMLSLLTSSKPIFFHETDLNISITKISETYPLTFSSVSFYARLKSIQRGQYKIPESRRIRHLNIVTQFGSRVRYFLNNSDVCRILALKSKEDIWSGLIFSHQFNVHNF